MAKKLNSRAAAFFAMIALMGLSPVPSAATVPDRVEEGCGGALPSCAPKDKWKCQNFGFPTEENMCDPKDCTIKES